MDNVCSEVVWRPWAGQRLEEKLCGLQPTGREGQSDWIFEQLPSAHTAQ